MEFNTLINADALTLFERIESEFVDLVYLDPPWFAMTIDKRQNQSKEDDYNEFIYKIVQQSKRVLKETGSLVFYSEPFYNIKFQHIIAKVFGTDNFVSEYIIPQKYRMKSPRHSTLHFYRKSEKHYFNSQIERTEEEIKMLFPNVEARGRFRFTTLFSRMERIPSMTYEWNGIKPLEGNSWIYTKTKIQELFDKGLIDTSRKGQPRLKRFADENLKKEIDNDTFAEIMKLVKRPYKGYPYPATQPEELLEMIIKLS